MSVREAALEALRQSIATVRPASDVKRNVDVPASVGPGGLFIVRDGEPGEPSVSLSPPSYEWQHQADVEIYADGATTAARGSLLDALLMDLGATIIADPTLGGAVLWAEPSAPSRRDQPSDGGAALASAIVTVTLVYTTTSPLG
ncbi:hypothetical protein J2X65_001652 [Ancylobacter sp. 3268]|uniref:hypothetical protein n=1 Tax=Ancylobacter sp. 3268 TaxID=2817752 RepID=UPI00285F27E7|nr:hypothetical protein [Ancylobacter sp. 3268]MDR6952297.1 hypothetical protein [Ancylobacter sp. 3268]